LKIWLFVEDESQYISERVSARSIVSHDYDSDDGFVVPNEDPELGSGEDTDEESGESYADEASNDDSDAEPDEEPDSVWLSHFQHLHDFLPKVQQLTIVDGHYSHEDRTIGIVTRSVESYVGLKYLRSWDFRFCWRVNGFRIDATLLREGIEPEEDPIWHQLELIQKRWNKVENEEPWQLPNIDIKVIVSASDEARLL
jgi:hypothetical protein